MAQYKISNEKYGETTYFTEAEREEIVNGIIESMFTDAEIKREYDNRCYLLGEDEKPEFTEAGIKHEWIDELELDIEELDTDNYRIIMDNAGGITLQLGEWAHYYNGAESDIAKAIADWISDGTTEGWEGHEIEALDIDTDTDSFNWTVVSFDGISVRDVVIDMLNNSAWDKLICELVKYLD